MNMIVYLKMDLEKWKWAEEKYMNTLAWLCAIGPSQDQNSILHQLNDGMPLQGRTKN